MLKYLTLTKIWNFFLLRFSYLLSKTFKSNIHHGQPFSISIEPTTACNLACPECPSGLKAFTRPEGNLKTNLNQKLIDELANKLISIYFYFQGEPFINPDLLEMIKYAHNKKIYTVTSSNGHFFNNNIAKKTVLSGLDKLIISIDGTTQEIYENYRVNGSLEKVINGVENIIHWKKQLKSNSPEVILQFLVTAKNEHQIPTLKKLGETLGVNKVKLKTIQVYDYKGGNNLIPKNEKYSRYKQIKKGTYKLKNKLTNSCWRMWSSSVSTHDGRIVPCCFDKDAQHQLGQIKDNDFNSIWNNKHYNNFRKNILANRKAIDICQNCTEGTKVWV